MFNIRLVCTNLDDCNRKISNRCYEKECKCGYQPACDLTSESCFDENSMEEDKADDTKATCMVNYE